MPSTSGRSSRTDNGKSLQVRTDERGRRYYLIGLAGSAASRSGGAPLSLHVEVHYVRTGLGDLEMREGRACPVEWILALIRDLLSV